MQTVATYELEFILLDSMTSHNQVGFHARTYETEGNYTCIYMIFLMACKHAIFFELSEKLGYSLNTWLVCYNMLEAPLVEYKAIRFP